MCWQGKYSLTLSFPLAVGTRAARLLRHCSRGKPDSGSDKPIEYRHYIHICKMKRALIFLFVSAVACKQNIEEKIVLIPNGKHHIIERKYNGDILQQEVSYVKDSPILLIRDGKSVYYRNGEVWKVEYRDGGRQTGEFIELTNGRPIKYICFDSFGDTVFTREYDNRKIKYESGNIYPHGLLETDHFKNNKTVAYVSFIVQPPFVKIYVENYMIDLHNRDTIRPFDSDVEYNWAHYYTFKIPHKHKYEYVQYTYLIDSLRRLSALRVRDTVTFNPN
jgi:hypothetical protein